MLDECEINKKSIRNESTVAITMHPKFLQIIAPPLSEIQITMDDDELQICHKSALRHRVKQTLSY